MTAWWTGECVPFDLETDGPEPTEARIITAYVGEIRRPGGEGKPQVTPGQDWIVQPERPIPQEAIDVHGITNERAQAEGGPRADLIPQIAAQLAYGTAGPNGEIGSLPVVGHNLAYDFTLLDRELRRLDAGRLLTDVGSEVAALGGFGVNGALGVELDGVIVGAFHVIDTMILDKGIDTYRPGPKDPVTGEKLGGRNQLGPTAEFYRVPMTEAAHEASADALASARIAWAIARRCALAAGGSEEVAEFLRLYSDRRRPTEVAKSFDALSHLTLSELHAWQERAALAQAESFRQYCIDNPEYTEEKEIDIAGIDGRWPLRPLTDRDTVVDIATDLV